MLDAFLITGRETLEAALIIGVMLGYLSKTSNSSYKKTVVWAIAAAIVASILAAFLFHTLAGGFTGPAENIFEGSVMIIGSVLLTSMIIWMFTKANKTAAVEQRVAKHVHKSSYSHLGLFFLVFISILREGIETVLFLSALSYASELSILGGLAGVIAASILGYVVVKGLAKIPLRTVFSVSSILLVLFAAGLLAHGVHEFQEVGLFGGSTTPIYDMSVVLSEQSSFGSFLKGLFGYNANPSFLEVLFYMLYLFFAVTAFLALKKPTIKPSLA